MNRLDQMTSKGLQEGALPESSWSAATRSLRKDLGNAPEAVARLRPAFFLPSDKVNNDMGQPDPHRGNTDPLESLRNVPIQFGRMGEQSI